MTYEYVGSELDLFSAATNWKTYFSRILAPHIGDRVLEIGAGIGSNIPYLHNGRVKEWVSVEPDPELARRIQSSIDRGSLPAHCRVVTGTIEKIDPSAPFDAILYMDVLEHIADDAAELDRATRLLSAQGNLIVLAPAHQFLFSPFDSAVGHHRRYNRRTLAALTPANCRLVKLIMLDSVGFFASLVNRFFLKAQMPSKAQIALWDKRLVPLSRAVDPGTGFRFGKSVVAIWQRMP
jgi:hypothetical protein